jgi:hypothetical protein
VIHFRVRYEGLRDRLLRADRRVRLLRAAWLAVLVPLGLAVLRLAVALTAGWWWIPATGLAFAVAWLGTDRFARPTDLGRWLDRRFGLDDLVVTAVEVDRRGVRWPIELRLLDDAAIAVARLGATPALGARAVRREGETLAGVVLAAAGLWLVAVTVRPLPLPERLPDVSGVGIGLDGARAPGDGGGSLPGASPGREPSPSAEMRALAGALADRAAARPVAAAIEQGDARGAARAARALGERADELSAPGRRDLAEALHAAADAVGKGDPALSDALRAAARALESPTSTGVQGALERLAAAIETLPTRGNAAGAIVQQPQVRSRAAAPAPRLDVTAVPASLGAASGGTRAGGVNAGGRARADAPVVAPEPVVGGGGAPGGSSGGTDPLAYPWAQREVVRRYFARAAGDP